MEFAQSGRRVVGRQVRSYEPEPLRPGSNVMFQIADLLTGEISGPDPGTTLTATETETETLTDGGVTMSCTYVWTHVYQISGNNGIAGQGRMEGTTTFPGITPASCTGTLPPGVFPTFFQRPAGVRQQVFVPAP